MAVSDWSTDAAANTSLSGINLGENSMTPGSINNAFRQIMADVRVFYGEVPDPNGKMNVSGGAFTGDITRATRGAYLHYVDPALSSGRVFVQPTGGSPPAGMVNGDILLEY